jgi:hypothetical protein
MRFCVRKVKLSAVHRAHFAAGIRQELNRPVVVVCADEGEAERMARDLAALSGEAVRTLSAREFTFHNAAVVSRQYEHRRLSTLRALAAGESQEVILRRFELALLQELGYGLLLETDADDAPVRGDTRYAYIIERGPISLEGFDAAGDELATVTGKTLLDMAAGDFRDPETLAQSKALMRRLIQHYLGGQQLQSRRVFTELFAFPGDLS